MIRGRRGVALLFALVGVVLLHALAAVALWASLADLRTVAGARLGIEGEIAASSALASARIDHRAALEALLPGERVALPAATVAAWRVAIDAERSGDLVLLSARAEWRTASDSLIGARRLTLVLARDASDTLRVLRGRSLF